MANALNVNLEKGQKVILKNKYYPGDEIARTFVCNGGFGMMNFTSGSAIFGTFLSGQEGRVEGYEIESLCGKTKEE